MLRIQVELLPHGEEEGLRVLSVIEVANVTGPERASRDYAWRITSADGKADHGYLRDRAGGDHLDLIRAVLDQRARGGLPIDHHGRTRVPEGMPDDPADAWVRSP